MSRTDVKRDSYRENHHLLLVGGGPRSIIQVKTEIGFMLLYKSHFQELMQVGARYRIKTTVVEKQRKVGLGASFSGNQTGMANTGIESNISFPLPLESTGEEVDAIKGMLSYKQRYEERFGQDPEAYYNELKISNLPGAVMFRRSLGPMSATPSGKLDQSGSFLMRKTIGEEEYEHFTKVRRLAQGQIPFYKLIVKHSSLLEGISANDRTMPIASIRNFEMDHLQLIQADQIRLNTGTTLKNPVSDSGVRDRTFCQPMNAVDMRRFFSQRGMLGGDGKIVPGVKILCGGLSLSALDQISALDGIMNLFEQDDSNLLGYRVTERAKHLYQNAITFVSRTPGKACVPRHSYSLEWQQDTPVIGTTKHLHALFLHENGEQVFQLWIDFLKASIARASNCTPDELDKVSSIAGLLSSKFEETRWFLDCRRKAGLAEMQGDMAAKERLLRESTQTLSGAWRQAALSVVLGFGPESDVEHATTEMERLAPITFKGRQAMLMHRAQMHSITHPRTAFKASNKDLVSNWRKLMTYVTASPVEIHSMFHLLLESGIANCVSASYSEISCDATGRSLHLSGQEYNAFVVSPVFERSLDNAVNSLTGQVRPIHPNQPSYGEVGKFRRFISQEGKPVAVEDNGLGGAGFHLKEGDGKGSLVGAFSPDINNRASAASTAASFAMRRMAMSHLKAAGIKSPNSVLDAIYERQKPDERLYEAEVWSFKKYFDEAYEMWAYLETIKTVAGSDADKFRKLYDAGVSGEGRKTEVLKLSSTDSLDAQEAAMGYIANVGATPKFNPAGRDEYLSRFVDTTADEDVAAYEEAFKLAKQHLTGRWQNRVGNLYQLQTVNAETPPLR